ncbi:MAG: hypothetical protein AAFS00_20170, partial [Bacteroidota bacterium]
EDSIYPPTSKQVHDAGNFPANAKAAACALQPPDPTRTMAFMNELIQEVRAKPILAFLSQKFWESASSLDDDSYLKLKNQTIEMLRTLQLFLTYDSLDEDFEEYDCQSPLPYEELIRKTKHQTASKVRKEWLIELQQYVGYVERYSSIRGSDEQNKAESLDKVISEWKETFRLTTFSGFNDVKRFYRMYEEYEKLKNMGCKICTVCGCRRRTSAGGLKDAVNSVHLLQLSESEVERFEGLVHSDDDRIGKLAQQCFHIEKLGENYYYILDLDEEKYYSKQSDYSVA